MAVKYDKAKFKRFRGGIERMFDGFGEDLALVGEVGRDEIVRATLAGIGEDDRPFKEYSKSYKDILESVGGKPGGVVNLRGVFFHERKGGKSRKISARMRRMGAGRRAYVRVEIGGRSFVARTKTTRPQRGLEDRESEMSVDLIAVEADEEKSKVKLTYRPRAEKYMIFHQDTRKWFTLRRASVKASLVETMKQLLSARVQAVRDAI